MRSHQHLTVITHPPHPLRHIALLLTMALGLAATWVAIATDEPAHAASSVSVRNTVDGSNVVDATYGTTLQLSGTGFQSIEGGHGGIYVFFGTVNSSWRPSQGGQTGRDYFYVPDEETNTNQGFMKFVTFPGNTTTGSAAHAQMNSDGSWSLDINVPGAKFQAVDRDGGVYDVDCTTVQCGIITVGAHGVVNANNETFTPVNVGDLYGGQAPASEGTSSSSTSSTPQQGTTGTPSQDTAAATEGEQANNAAIATVAELSVDRTAAMPGRILTFSAVGLVPGELVVATLDDGVAAAGPIAVGTNGQVAGALELPVDLDPGTHTLKLSGEQGLTVSFAVRPLDDAEGTPWLAISITAAAALLLIVAVIISVLWIRSARRKAAVA